MHLIVLGAARWQVKAVCNDNGDCEVLEFLSENSGKLATRMLALLRETVPQIGPENLGGNKVKKLRGFDSVLEFRLNQNKGPGMRVLWFFDRNRTVVCTHAFDKRERSPTGLYRAAQKLRDQYMIDRDANRLTEER